MLLLDFLLVLLYCCSRCIGVVAQHCNVAAVFIFYCCCCFCCLEWPLVNGLGFLNQLCTQSKGGITHRQRSRIVPSCPGSNLTAGKKEPKTFSENLRAAALNCSVSTHSAKVILKKMRSKYKFHQCRTCFSISVCCSRNLKEIFNLATKVEIVNLTFFCSQVGSCSEQIILNRCHFPNARISS